jgi:hypothetical protein
VFHTDDEFFLGWHDGNASLLSMMAEQPGVDLVA